MALLYSEYLQISHHDLNMKGVYDGALDQDHMLHIDPLLLKNCRVPEFDGAYEEFLSYFERFITLVPFVKTRSKTDRFYKKIYDSFRFPEQANTGLGYSTAGTHGNGISGKIAQQLTESTIEIIQAGFQDTAIFALMPLFEENIGADRISDMTISILYDRFINYTARITSELKINSHGFKYKGTIVGLPAYKKRPIVFIPASILTDLPHALDYDDVDHVCDYNRKLRVRIGMQIGLTLKDAAALKKAELKKILFDNPQYMQDAITAYKSFVGVSYDFYEDRKDKYIEARLRDMTMSHPLDLGNINSQQPLSVLDTTRAIVNQFKSLVEDNHLWKIFKRHKSTPIETDWQYFIYAVALTYVKAAKLNIDVTRENNPGVGAIDFKLSCGAEGKTIVEVKRSSNQDLLHGYVTQLPQYMTAESASDGIFLIIKENAENDAAIEKVFAHRQTLIASNAYAPEIIVVDVEPKKTASKIN